MQLRSLGIKAKYGGFVMSRATSLATCPLKNPCTPLDNLRAFLSTCTFTCPVLENCVRLVCKKCNFPDAGLLTMNPCFACLFVLFYVWGCFVCMDVCLLSGAHRGQKEGIRSLGTGVTVACEPPCKSWNSTQVLYKSSRCS